MLNAIAHACLGCRRSRRSRPSTKTRLTFEGAGDFEADDYGAAISTSGPRARHGLDLQRSLVVEITPVWLRLLIFSDYMKPPIRLAAIMELPVVYVLHDPIGVGEDGPTHQPVEQVVALRSIPGLIVLRPADANEVVEAWRVVLGLRHEPACLILSRQNLPTLDRTRYAPASGARRGAYVLADARNGKPEIIPDRHRQRGGTLRRGL